MKKLKAWYNGLTAKQQKKAQILGAFIALIILSSLFQAASATERYYVENTYVNESITNEVNRSALGVADLQFNLATKDPQWAASFAKFDGSQAGKVAIGQKMDNVFVSGTVARENGHTGFGVSVSGKF